MTQKRDGGPAVDASTYVHLVQPGRGLGALILGSSLWDVLRFLDLNKDLYPKQDYIFSNSAVSLPSYLTLPRNGIHLHFDGPQQTLRLIEVVDFSKIKLAYDGHEVGRSNGPSYRHVTNLFGPTFPGEYLPPHTDEEVPGGSYILSWPGIAVRFPVDAIAWKSKTATSNFLSSGATRPAQCIALFKGASWPEVRSTLYSMTALSTEPRKRYKYDPYDSVDLAKIHGEGQVELTMRSGSSLWITLSETTPQDLVSDLGPPDAIYRKTDRRLSIHRSSTNDSSGSGRPTRSKTTSAAASLGHPTMTSGETLDQHEHFYNYFRLGLDFLISKPTARSIPSPTVPEAKTFASSTASKPFRSNQLTATKVLIHGNVPGSYDFNRYRRLRWSIEHCPTASEMTPLTSEMPWAGEISGIERRLQEVWRSVYASDADAAKKQQAMSFDRADYATSGGEGLDGSVELLGDSDEEASLASSASGLVGPGRAGDEKEHIISSSSSLYGFPGMVFEVLKDGNIGCLQVF